jgi:hypothetical protein
MFYLGSEHFFFSDLIEKRYRYQAKHTFVLPFKVSRSKFYVVLKDTRTVARRILTKIKDNLTNKSRKRIIPDPDLVDKKPPDPGSAALPTTVKA